MEKFQKLIDNILNPSEEFTPIPFWFLNDTLEISKLRQQLEDFKDKGVNAVILHPRIGIPKELPYLSEEYFCIIKETVKAASTLHMKIVLYDEGMYPSGSAHGEVVKINPGYASKGITIRKNAGDGKIIASLGDGNLLVQDFTNGTIRGIHFGEDDGESGAPKSADILNPSAVDCFITLTHDAYYRHLKKYFGNTVIGFFTDEPCVMGRNITEFFPWTDGLEAELTEKGANLPELAALFKGEENASTVIYKESIRQRLCKVYYKKLSDWCENHGIWLMGHPEKSDDIDEETYFHVPGQDLVFRWVSPENGGLTGIDSVQAKCSSDAARHTGKRRNSNECFGVCARPDNPFHLTSGDMKWMTDWLGVRGVNMLIPHAFYYSLRGKRLMERPPDVGPGNIWWQYYKLYSDYVKRVSYIMTDSKNCAKTAVICESGNMPDNPEFYENQVEFNYLPKRLLCNAEMSHDSFSIGGYSYPYYMADEDMNLPGKRISSFSEIPDRDFIPVKPFDKLRCSHLIKDGIDLYFFTNEGEKPLEVNGSVPVKGTAVYFDLWNSDIWQENPLQTDADGRIPLSFSLNRRESLLVLISPQSGEKIYPQKSRQKLLNLNFTLTSENELTKEYTGECIIDEPAGNEIVTVEADEMVVCLCNGEFAGVSLWNPHCFNVGKHLKPGLNKIKLAVTGSAANKYSPPGVAFGLRDINI